MVPLLDAESYIRLVTLERQLAARRPDARWRREWLAATHRTSLLSASGRVAGRALVAAGRRLLEWGGEALSTQTDPA